MSSNKKTSLKTYSLLLFGFFIFVGTFLLNNPKSVLASGSDVSIYAVLTTPPTTYTFTPSDWSFNCSSNGGGSCAYFLQNGTLGNSGTASLISTGSSLVVNLANYGTGDHYIEIQANQPFPSQNDYLGTYLGGYVLFHWDGTSVTFPSISSSPAITTFSINHTTGMVTVGGYWNGPDASSTSEIQFWQSSPAFGQESYAQVDATSTGNFSFSFPFLDSSFTTSNGSTTYTLGSGTTFYGKLYQVFNNFDPFSATGTAPLLIDATSTTISATSTVNVDTGSSRSLSGLTVDCGLTSLAGCLQNAAVWLFYPTTDTLNQFSTLSLNGKFPFTYIYQVGQIRESLFSASSTAPTALTVDLWRLPGSSSTTTLTLLQKSQVSAVPYAGTVYNITTWLIWLGMVEYIYYRVIRVHDTHTPV